MFSPNNPNWTRADWVILAIMLLASTLMLLWCGIIAYAAVAPLWLTLPLALAYLAWSWRPMVRWWRRHG